MRKRKAVSLIEVLITVAILSGGIVFVFRAFMASLSAASLSQEMMLASYLAQDKLWQISELNREKKLQDNLGTETINLQNNNPSTSREFSLKYEISPADIEGLNKLGVSVSWPKDKRSAHSLIFSTYLYAEH